MRRHVGERKHIFLARHCIKMLKSQGRRSHEKAVAVLAHSDAAESPLSAAELAAVRNFALSFGPAAQFGFSSFNDSYLGGYTITAVFLIFDTQNKVVHAVTRTRYSE